MPRRRDDDFDDDDRPRRRRRRDEDAGSGVGLWLGIGLGVGALVVVGVIVLLATRKKNDAVQNPPTQPQPQQPAPAPKPPVKPPEQPPRENILRSKPAAKAPRGRPGANWQKAIGLWRREQPKDDPGQFPVEFEFRGDFTARAQHNRPKDTVIHEALVEVNIDEGEFLSLTLHMENGQYNYPLKLKPDGTLLLDRSPALTYVRVK